MTSEFHRYGYGVEADHTKAVSYYERTITSESGLEGKVSARFALGCMYESGQGGLTQNNEKAFVHFEFAANRMHKEAQWKVGVACELGTGVDCSVDRAIHYYRLAASNGHQQAQFKASDYYMQGKGISRVLQTETQILQVVSEIDIRERSESSANSVQCKNKQKCAKYCIGGCAIDQRRDEKIVMIFSPLIKRKNRALANSWAISSQEA